MSKHPWGLQDWSPQGRHHGGNTEPRGKKPCSCCGRVVADGSLEMGLCWKCVLPPSHYEPMGRPQPVKVLKSSDEAFVGGTLNQEQFEQSLKMGVLPLGMVVRHPNGDILAVCGKGKYYRDPAEVLPREWTREL